MGILVQNGWRNRAIFATIMIMLVGLFVSRALLSIGLIVFVAFTTIHGDLFRQCKKFLTSPFLAALSILFLIPLVSGLWSNDLEEWGKVLLVKAPFFLLPLAFAGRWELGEKGWINIALFFFLLVVLSCCWSLCAYWVDREFINESYLRAKTLPTLLDGDHVRFSWTVCLGVITMVLLLDQRLIRRVKLAAVLLVIPVVYLHVLSARTGLVMLYLFVPGYCLYKLRQSPRLSFGLAGVLIGILVLSWFCFPTLRNRVRYNLYDFSMVWKGEYRSGMSDGNRVVSFRAGWQVWKEHPVFGVGAGDLRAEVNNWYDAHMDGMKEEDMLYPSSEWLVYGGMAGWPGCILFTVVVLLPFFVKPFRYRFFWTMLHLISVVGFLIETSLEIQFGVFIYCFFVLWWWKWFGFGLSSYEGKGPETFNKTLSGKPNKFEL